MNQWDEDIEIIINALKALDESSGYDAAIIESLKLLLTNTEYDENLILLLKYGLTKGQK